MAKAGFYIIAENEPGSVKCFVCLKPLDGWERDDDPLYDKNSKKVTFNSLFSNHET